MPLPAYSNLRSYALITVLTVFVVSDFNRSSAKQFFITLPWVILSVNGLLFLISQFTYSIMGYNLWYSLTLMRFSGLSLSPDYIALSMLIVPFLLLNSYFNGLVKHNKPVLFSYFFAICLTFYIGFKTDSDALLISWILVFPIYCIHCLSFDNNNFFRRIKTKLSFLIFLILSSVLFYALFNFQQANFLEGVLNIQADMPHRVILLKYSLTPLLDSILIGYGPGSFSGIEESFSGYDSHNSYVEFSISTGVLGLLLLLYLLTPIISFLKKNNIHILAALISMCIFAVAHNIFMHPIFFTFIAVAMCLNKKNIMGKL